MIPREQRGEAASGETCHHGRALQGEGCPACGAEAGEGTAGAVLLDGPVIHCARCGCVSSSVRRDHDNVARCATCYREEFPR
jgi:hypothetical protein